MKFDERNQIFFKSPFFYFHGHCGKVCPTIQIVLACLVPLRVDVTGNITANLCEAWSELRKIAPWLPWQRPPF
jgi:hypothetical protein